MNNEYDDIINLPHFEPQNHKRMSMLARASQFAPFAALNGHEEAIMETARLTDRKIELEEDAKKELDIKMTNILSHIKDHPYIEIIHFVADEKKEGGHYELTSGTAKKDDEYEKSIIMSNGRQIYLDSIVDVEIKKQD